MGRIMAYFSKYALIGRSVELGEFLSGHPVSFTQSLPPKGNKLGDLITERSKLKDRLRLIEAEIQVLANDR